MTTPIIPVAPTFVPPAGAVWVAAVARSPAGAIYITTAAPDADAVTCNGLLMTPQGVLYAEEVTP